MNEGNQVYLVLISNEHGHVYVDSAWEYEDNAKEYRKEIFKKFKRDKLDAHSIAIHTVDVQPKSLVKVIK